jgi:hypothetical protein
MKKQIYCFVFLLLVFTSFKAQTLQLSDHAGLKLQLESNGTISAVELNGAALPNGSMGGFYSRDPLNATKVPLTGTVSTLSDGRIQLKLSNSLNDSVTALITEGAGFIEVTGELKDLTGSDRGLWLGFNLPVNTIGWTWGHKLNTANLVVTNAAPGYSGDDRLLVPIPAVWRTNGGIALCIPPTDPCVFENSADANGLRIQMAYGLSPITAKFPSKAPFRFRIYTIDGTWGFRDALAKYYDWYPDYYSIEPSAMKRLDHKRRWITENYENEGPTKNDMASITSPELGQYCAYTKLTARPAGMTGVEALLVTDTLGYLNAIANCTDIMHYKRKAAITDPSLVEARAAISNCVAYNPDRSWSMEYAPAAGVLDIGHNVSPNLFKDAAHPNSPVYGDMYLRRPAKLLGLNPNFTFIHWDRLGGRSMIANYRREHFAYTAHPLTFDQSMRLCLPTQFTNYELFDAFRLQAKQGGMFHEGAGMEDFQARGGEFLGGQDRIGMFFMGSVVQSSWNEDGGKYHDLGYYDRYRIFLGRKAYRVGCPLPSWTLSQGWEPLNLIKRTLADATAMGLVACVADSYCYKTDNPLHDSINSLFYTEQHQALWNSYIPASEAIRLAGWEPVTHALSSSSDVAVNRFGRGDTIYMTVWSPNPPSTVEIEVDSVGLGLTNNPAFSEILSNTQITVTKSTKGWKLAFSMEQYITRIIKILRKGSQTAVVTNSISNANDVQIYPNPTKSIINLKSTHEIKSLEVCDLSGKLIMKTINPKNSVDLSSIQKGMYFLKISLDKGVIVNKIIKE